MGLDVLVPIFGILVVRVPVTGRTAVFTLRLGGKPFVETPARELKGVGEERSSELESRFRDLADQVEALTSEVHELRSTQAFDRELLESTEADPRTL